MSFKDDAKVIMADLKLAFNGDISVESSKNDLGDISTYVAVCEDDVWLNTRTYATVGLSTVSTGYILDGLELAVELATVVNSNVLDYGNVLGSIVTNVKSFGKSCVDGSIHDDILSMYYPDVFTKHVYLTQSWLWDELYVTDIGDRKVTWLTPIPITDAERDYIKEHGGKSFLNKLEQHNVEVQDIYRESII